ncbi:hypothetical protein [Streptomyces sp. NPDC001978]|uniref:hypothetical protein n=1 Tax=Streptomyces sp. NPDC001978 TaxID=3364627 RepID=UPI0036B583DC
MTKQLTTQNATITRVAVEVKALTISGRQGTLSVFRQLQEEQLVADDGTLNGVPWGYVNYHPDRCGESSDRWYTPHWHIVWQRGDELVRSRVDHELRRTAWGCAEGDAFLSAHAREIFEGRGRYFDGTLPAIDNGLTVNLNHEAAFPVTMQFAQPLARALFAWMEWHAAAKRLAEAPNSFPTGTEDWRRKQLAEAVEALSSAPPEPQEVDELYAAYREKLTTEAARRQRHRDVRADLAQLPQLFIAV